MNFDLTEEQELFRATAERYAAPLDSAARRGLREAPGGFPRERWRELAELGLIALAAGEEAGGIGGSITDLAVVAEALGKGISAAPWLENGVLPALLLASGGERERLAGVLDGTVMVAAALFERGQRYELAPRATRAMPESQASRLDGEKTLVLGGALADELLVLADCDGTAGWFALPADARGVHSRAYTIVDGSIATEVQFNAARVPADARLALDAAAFAEIVAKVRVIAAAEMVGLADRLLEETIAYTRQREQFGVSLSSFQALQHRMVECYAALEQARSMLWRTVLAAESGDARWRHQASGAKAFIAENALQVGREAIQMHGGMGITDELAVGHAFKRVLLLEKLFGGRAEGLVHYAEAA